ncbi:unnamed protein product [Blepharisma stoltei]|uniref:Trichohyalin-plectin-homology domain-containing protein n=1 Tax=Blepharisma stoltei TaxID=1481888 RepID=A0AAU9KBE4_9CILI|nr:unnamed protein product [Blepharisma stoltei]
MYRKKPQDEWGLIIQQQVEFNKKREEEEKERIQQEKDNYRRDLEYQNYLRELAKEQQRKQREFEAQTVEAQIKAFKENEEKRKIEESQQKKSLHETYDQHYQYKKQMHDNERIAKLEQEQMHLARVKAQMAADELKRKEAVEKALRDEEEVLRVRRYQEELQKQMKENEKLYDIELARARKEAEEQKERQYREYYNKIAEKQAVQQHQYEKLVAKTDLYRKNRVNEWIDQGYQFNIKSQAEREEYEKQVRLQAKNNMSEMLQKQLELKELEKQQRKEEIKRQAEITQRQLEEFKRAEMEKANQRKFQQQNYRNFLNVQANSANDIRDSVFKLSDVEKKLNRVALQGYEDTPKSQLQRNATNMLRSSSQNSLQNNDFTKRYVENLMSPKIGTENSSPKLRNNSMSSLDPAMKAAGKPTRLPYIDQKLESNFLKI